MKEQQKEKTNAMRLLEQQKIVYKDYTYNTKQAISGVEVAKLLEQDQEQVFKTLVTVGKSLGHYVFMIPVAEELDLKKAAKITGEKSIEMVKSKEMLGLTGYIHGGCSPIGMKKIFPTFIHETVILYDTIIFSGGKIGYQVEISLQELQQLVDVKVADITK